MYLRILQVVARVSEANEPYNPYISEVQTVGYPIPLFGEYSEADYYDASAGEWVRGVIIAIERFYYVFRRIDLEKLTELKKEALASMYTNILLFPPITPYSSVDGLGII